MNRLEQEALWAIQTLKQTGQLQQADSAVMFVSLNSLDVYLNALKSTWDHPDVLHAVAIKTQPHVSILKHIVARGFGLEAATWEEVQLARKAGCPPERIVFDSPVKRTHEIEDCALHSPGMLLNANCLEELNRLMPFAGKIRIGLRINPMVTTDAPSVYSVSQNESKFGVPISDHENILHAILQYPIETLHVHTGSSMKNMVGAINAIKNLVKLARDANEQLKKTGANHRIKQIDIGGGIMPELLENEKSPAMAHYVKQLRIEAPEIWSEFQLVTEFGQWTHFYTGYAYSDIEYVVHRNNRQIAFLHLGADFLVRDIYVKPRGINWLPLRDFSPLPGPTQHTDFAGPLCFAGDFLEKGVSMPAFREGDGLLLLGTGSNAYALWSRHTSRTIPALYGVDFQQRKLSLFSGRTNPFI